MAKQELLVTVSDAPHRKKLYLQFRIDNEHFAEISVDEEEPFIEIYPHRTDQNWKFDYQILSRIILEGNEFLASMGIKPPS